MKKILLSLCLLMFVGVAVNAQSSCCAKKSASAKSCNKKAEVQTKVASAYMEADKIAENDPSIQKRVCEESGSISYFQKSECSVSGKISWDEVEFNAKEKKFTKVASAYMVKDGVDTEDTKSEKKSTKKACCSKDEAKSKSCCSKKAKASCSKKAGA